MKKYSDKREVMKTCVFLHYDGLGHKSDDSCLLNVDVTCDGTWFIKGCKSHIRIVAVIECKTDL